MQARDGLAPAAHLALEARDVVLVELDLLLVGLEPVEHPLIIALAAQPYRFLFRQLLARLIEQFLLAGQLVLQYLAAILIALTLYVGVHAGKRRRRRGGGRLGLRWWLECRYRVGRTYIQHLAAFCLGFDVGETLAAVRIHTFPDIGTHGTREQAD